VSVAEDSSGSVQAHIDSRASCLLGQLAFLLRAGLFVF